MHLILLNTALCRLHDLFPDHFDTAFCFHQMTLDFDFHASDLNCFHSLQISHFREVASVFHGIFDIYFTFVVPKSPDYARQ